MSSPWPAMPSTRVPNRIGTMIDLIIRRKVVDSGRSDWAKSGKAQPTMVPSTMENKIHWVSERCLRKVHMGFPVVDSPAVWLRGQDGYAFREDRAARDGTAGCTGSSGCSS